MFRIGILGSENSHAEAFAKIYNGFEEAYRGEFDDIRVVGSFSHYPEADKALVENCGVEFIAERPEDLLGKVDAVMITARDGKYQAGFARPFIEAGIPAFIDKPFTSSGEEAIAIARLAKEKNVPLFGGSSLKLCQEVKRLAAYVRDHADKLRGGSVIAPVSMKNDYGDFYFYSSHLVEICLPVFGYNPQWVYASETPSGACVLTHYGDFDVTNHFTQGLFKYVGTVLTTEEVFSLPIDLSTIYVEEARSFARMLRTGKMEFTYEQLVQPMLYLNAVDKSMKTGTRQMVEIAKL